MCGYARAPSNSTRSGSLARKGRLREGEIKRCVRGQGFWNEFAKDPEEARGSVVVYQHEMVYYLKDPEEALRESGYREPVLTAEHKPIIFSRNTEFVVGPAECEGEGTEGLQTWREKTWWDESGFEKLVAERRAGGEASKV